MATRNPQVDAYIAAAAPFARPILKHLRKLVHAACPTIEEKIKWGMPFFDHKGSVAHMAAFKEHCAFGFWKSTLLFRPEQRAEREAMGQFGRITRLDDLPNDKTLIAYLRQAVQLNEAGIKQPRAPREKTPRPLEVPDDFAAALRKQPAARKTFDRFSPSQRREYVEWISEAKREETRRRRMATALEWLGEGKTLRWKYEQRTAGARRER